MLDAHSDVKIYAAKLDRELDKMCYILPGLGDAGDRLWAVR
jgi:uracil phosphoribosyltransferase